MGRFRISPLRSGRRSPDTELVNSVGSSLAECPLRISLLRSGRRSPDTELVNSVGSSLAECPLLRRSDWLRRFVSIPC